MENPLLIAVFAGLGGMLGWGLADFFAKKTIDQIGDVASLAWGHIFGTAVLLLMVFFNLFVRHQGLHLPQDGHAWLYVILFGIVQAAVYLFVYKGFGKGQIAVLNPVFASFSGITAVLSILIFKETLSSHLLAALIVLFCGIVLISTDFAALRAKRFDFSHIPGFPEVILATVMAGFWTLFWDRFIGGRDWLIYTALMYVAMTITILAVANAQNVNLKIRDRSIWPYVFLIGLCETVAYLAVSIGYSQTSFTSIVALLSGAFSLPTIILARAFLREKITRLQTLGSLVIIAGIVLLALF